MVLTEYHQTWRKTEGILCSKYHMICSKGPLSSDFESSCEVLVTAKGFLEGEKACWSLLKWFLDGCTVRKCSMSWGAASKDIPLDWRPGYQTVARHSSRSFQAFHRFISGKLQEFLSIFPCSKAIRDMQLQHMKRVDVVIEAAWFDAFLDAHLCRHFVDIICWER